MQNSNISEILSLFNDEKHGVYNIFEIHHALIEYIKSGKAISDMGHPDFFFGATENSAYNYSSYRPSLAIFQLAKAFSNCLKQFDTKLIWYRDLSTWKDFCKFVMEVHLTKSLKKKRRLVISHNYYLHNSECPACGIRRFNLYSSEEDKIDLFKKNNLVYIDCRRCGTYILTTGTFKYLDEFEKKSKLFVYLTTRPERKHELKITPKFLREIIK